MQKGLTLLILLIFLAGCDTLRKKEHMDEVLPPLEVPPSYLSFRVNFPASELEKGLNRVIPKLLLDDAIPLKDKRDTLFLRLLRKGRLNLSVREGVLEATIPLDVSVSVKKKWLGITFSNEDAPVQLTGTVKATAEIKLRDDWEFDIVCDWTGFEWNDAPKIAIGGFSMDIGGNVDRFLESNSDLLADIICNAIHQSISFRHILTNVWNDVQDPFKIRMPDKNLWMHSTPIALSGVAIPKNDTLTVNLEYRTLLNLSFENKSSNRIPLPKRTTSLNNRSAFLAYPEVFLSYRELQGILEKQLKGQPLTYEGYTTTLEDISLGPVGQRLQAALKVSGDIEGTLVFSGIPHLDENQELSLEEFDYEFEASDGWIALTELAMHSFIEEYISSFLNVDLREVLNKLDQTLVSGMQHSPLGEKLAISLAIRRFESYQLRMTETGLQWIFFIEGNSELNLKEGVIK